jgi:TolB protein
MKRRPLEAVSIIPLTLSLSKGEPVASTIVRASTKPLILSLSKEARAALLFIFSVLASAFPLRAAGPLFLELSAKGQRVDMGLAEFSVEKGEAPDRARLLRDVVKYDLTFPKLFNLIEGGGASDKIKPSLSRWSTLGADLLVTGVVDRSFGSARFTGAVRDVATGDVVLEKTFPLEPGGERADAHAFADEVLKYFTGQAGVAQSRIVFVNDATGKKEVCVVDYDGAGFRRITNDRSIALFPKASPDGKSIVFTTFKEGRPEIFLLGFDAKSRPLCRYDGLNSAAAWFPDGRALVATLSLGRDPSLHVVDLEGRVVRTLTNTAAADTAPSLSPDGLQVAFTSDRPGRPQIYVMNTSGANMRRLVETDGWCDSPAWSPQGHLVAFTMSEHGRNFDIFTAEVGTGRLTRLTYGEGDNENAAWSPDGRWLVFASSRRGKFELFVMGADGSLPRPLGDIPGRSFTPCWMSK